LSVTQAVERMGVEEKKRGNGLLTSTVAERELLGRGGLSTAEGERGRSPRVNNPTQMVENI